MRALGILMLISIATAAALAACDETLPPGQGQITPYQPVFSSRPISPFPVQSAFGATPPPSSPFPPMTPVTSPFPAYSPIMSPLPSTRPQP